MWRSIFLHEFIDHEISNFQAVAGQATPASLALTPTVDSGVNSVEITPGKGFEYLIAQPLQQVIGVSCRVRLVCPDPFLDPNGAFVQGLVFSVMRLGNAAELQFVVDEPLDDGIKALARIRIGSQSINFASVALPARSFVDLRLDWHASGQARLSTNGSLVAYHNAVAPGALLDVDRVVFGLPDQPAFDGPPRYRIARVFVRALRRPDSLATLTRYFPVVEVGEDVGRCRLRSLANLLALLDRLRSFMNGFHQVTSTPWLREDGPPEGPFTPASITAHELAIAAGLAFTTMLRTNDFSTPELFLDPFTEFLRILRAARPTEFDSLAAELANADIVPAGCDDQLAEDRERNQQLLEPVISLLDAASRRVQQIAGGY